MPAEHISTKAGAIPTFVDGGYADNSGVDTALRLYNKLKQAGGDDVDLYLIALTDQSKAWRGAAGSEPTRSMPVYEALSPLTTLLSMRDLQSRKAVTEARTELGEKMIVVQLDEKAFPLPLGWKLSGLSSDIIRLTIGDPERCASADDYADKARSIANRNSCELKKIVGLLAPKSLTSQSLFTSPVPAVARPEPAAPPPKPIGDWTPNSSPH